MGLDAQKNFAQMNKNRDVEGGIRGQVMSLNSPMEKKATKEIRNGESAFNKGGKKNGFVRLLEKAIMPKSRSPLYNRLRLKKTFIDK